MKSGARARGGFARAVCVGIALSLGGACSGQDAKKSETATIATPTPARLADGAPNWTGFWIPVGGLLETVVATNPAAPKLPSTTTAIDVKSDDPAGLMKSPYKERYAQLLRKEELGEPAYDPTALCFPPGMPRMMNMTYGMELLQTAGQIAITSEWGPATRRIWLDGRVPTGSQALGSWPRTTSSNSARCVLISGKCVGSIKKPTSLFQCNSALYELS